jgi:dihydroorotate dehydrogenase
MLDLAPQHKHGLVLAGPVMNAAGVLGFAGEYRGLVDLARLGAFVTNPLTFGPRTPARPPNAAALGDGLLVHTGLPNPGVRAAVRRHNKEWQRLGPPVIVHLAATSEADVGRALEVLERADGVSGVEMGLRDDSHAGSAARLVRAARGGPPLIVRLPLESAAALAAAVVAAGANALTVAAPPRASIASGGHSLTGRHYGPATFAPALAAVQAVAALGLDAPIIAAGGVFSAEAARAMLAAGAVAVQVDALAWQHPRRLMEIIDLVVT